jgi:hypothetical protein
MKTKALLLLLVGVCLGHYGSATTSSLPQIGARWYYSTQFMTPDMGYYQLEYSKDTTISNTNCKIIEGLDLNSGKQISSRTIYYIVYDGGRIYQYVHSGFHLLYDFNVSVGDTITTTYPSSRNPQTAISMKLKVTGVNDTLINNELLRSYSFYSIDLGLKDECIGFSGTAIENIGNAKGYFFPIDCLITDMSKPTNFRCFDNGDWLYKSELFKNKECDSTFVYSPSATEGILFGSDVEIRFNDNRTSITISETGTATPILVIYDCLGKMCFNASVQTDTPLSISELSPGIYFLTVQLASQVVKVKFIK